MEFVTLGDFNGRAEQLQRCGGERFAGIAAIGKHILYFSQLILIDGKAFQGSGTIRDIGCGDAEHMRQAIGIHADMALDARDELASVEAFIFRRIRVFYTLRVNDQERSFRGPPKALSNGSDHIFLMLPARG